MISQLAIILMGLFLIVSGLANSDYLNVGLGTLITVFSAHTLYVLKAGK